MAKFEDFTLTPQLRKYCEDRSEKDVFLASLLQWADAHDGTITKNQLAAIKKRQQQDKERANRPKLRDEAGNLVGIVNERFRDGKPRCFIDDCRDFAKVAVGNIGVCEDHVEEGRVREREWHERHSHANGASSESKAAPAETSGAPA